MPGEAGVLDAPMVEEAVDAAAGVDAGEGGGDAAGDAAADAAGAADGDAAGAGTDEDAGEALTGAKLWNAAKEGLKSLDPALQKGINRAIHKLEGIERKFPEGVDKALTTLTAVRQLAEDPAMPVEKAIADTLAERGYFRELDAAYTEGKQAFVDKLFDAKPESFDKLAPMIFAKYSESNPDGFASYVSQTVLQHMAANDIPLQFKLLDTFLPQLPDGPAKDRVIEAARALYGWSEQIKGLAAKKPAVREPVKAAGAEGGDDREAKLAQREQAVTLQGWNNESLDGGVRAVYAEADRIAGKAKLSGDERKKVLGKVGEELDIRLAANKGYGEAMRGYLTAGNKQAYLQRLDAERKKLIPGAVKRAVGDVIDERAAAAAKPAAKAAAAAVAAAKPGAAAAAADTGEKVEWIGGYPNTQGLIVDLGRTPHSMLIKNRAYVKGRNTIVAWK